MLRRDFLKLIGIAAAAPALVVEKAALAGPIFDGEIIPTGFPIIDAALKGGFRRGGIHTIHGDEPQMLGESFARKMGEVASVALLTPFDRAMVGTSPYQGNVFVFPVKRPAFNAEMLFHVMKTHDVVMILNDLVYAQDDIRLMKEIALAEKTVVVWTSFAGRHYNALNVPDPHYPPRREFWDTRELSIETAPSPALYYMSDALICAQDQKDGMRELGSLFTFALTKNRWGESYIIEPVVLNEYGFISMEETPYWDYNPQTGKVSGPWRSLRGVVVERPDRSLTSFNLYRQEYRSHRCILDENNC